MKNKFLFIILLLFISLTSCNDWLTVDSPSSFDTKYVFSNEDDALKVVLGIYSCFPTDAFTSRMSNVFMMNTDVEIAEPGEFPDGSRRDVWSFQPSANFADIKTIWQICYLAIDRANQCIEGIKASPLYTSGNASMKQLLGESYCLRAYWYFLLCNYFGDVPFATEASKSGMNLNTPKVDKNIIYSQLIQDLIDSEEGMLFADQVTGGIERMNREFALGLIAKLSLFRAGYSMQYDGTMKRADDYQTYNEIAKKYAQKLITLKDRPLNPDFKQIFLNECKFLTPANDDVLYEVAFVQNNGGDVGWCIGLSVRGGTYGSGTSYIYLPISYYHSFNPKDLRLPVTCSLIEYQTESVQNMLTPKTINPGKWCRLWLPSSPGSTSTKGTGINWPLMRYSDVLLMLAEAENALNGPTDIAKDALKRVRNRAFSAADRPALVEDYVNALTSKEDFLNAIVNERAWEFGGECIRKFDLVRWNLYGKKIVETKNILTEMGWAGRNLSGHDTYASLANTIYYKKVNGIVTMLNTPYNRLAQAVIDTLKMVDKPSVGDNPNGYSSQDWTKNMAASDTTQSTFITRSFRGYTDETGASAVPYLLPISQDIINTSDGVLTNDGYGLKVN
jgi:starch-binding outer membrane protein, SusD/RagB family